MKRDAVDTNASTTGTNLDGPDKLGQMITLHMNILVLMRMVVKIYRWIW